jgi:hypothetical protein
MMAGLLDIFGSSGSQTLGLLGMSPEDVQRARDDAQAQAMYTLAGRLFQGGNTGRSIAEGLQLGQQAYKQAMQGQLVETLQGAQIQELLRQRQEAQAVKQRQESVNRIIGQAYQPAVAAAPNAFYGAETQMPLRDEEGNLMPGATPAVQARPAQFDLTGATPLLMALPEGRKALTEIVAAQKAMRPEGYTLGEGQVRYEMGPDGKPVAVASGTQKIKPLKEVDLGNVVVLLDETGKEVGRMKKGRAPEGPVSMQTVETEQGIMLLNPRTGALAPLMQDGKPILGKGAGNLTESQGNATTYGMRMSQAHEILKPLENAGLKDTGKIRAGVSGTLGAVPLIGETLARGSDNIFNTLPTILGGLNEDQQRTIQARVNFITAILRKESGASISPTEFATAEKNYFPAPGESPSIVKQKQDAREAAIEGMKLQAGPGKKFIGKPNVTSSGW